MAQEITAGVQSPRIGAMALPPYHMIAFLLDVITIVLCSRCASVDLFYAMTDSVPSLGLPDCRTIQPDWWHTCQPDAEQRS